MLYSTHGMKCNTETLTTTLRRGDYWRVPCGVGTNLDAKGDTNSKSVRARIMLISH